MKLKFKINPKKKKKICQLGKMGNGTRLGEDEIRNEDKIKTKIK